MKFPPLSLMLVFLAVSVVAQTTELYAQAPIFHLTFDDTLVGADGETPISSTGVEYVDGVLGSAAFIDTDDVIEYESLDNIDSQIGTIDFVVIPNWDGDDRMTHEFLVWDSASGDNGGGLLFSKDGANNLRQIFNRFSQGGQTELGTSTNVSAWVAGEPHYLAYSWNANERRIRQYVDGELIRDRDFPDGFVLPTITRSSFRLGRRTDAALDEMRIFVQELDGEDIAARYQQLFPAPIFHLTFDDTLVGADGETPISSTGVEYVDGVLGSAAFIDTDDVIEYASVDNINSQIGTIDFVVIPNWDGDDRMTHEFLVWDNAPGDNGGGLLFSKDGANNLRQIFNRFSQGGQTELGTSTNVSAWVAGEPRYLAYSWNANERRIRQYVDGELIRDREFPDGFVLPTITRSLFRLGRRTDAALDEMRIFDQELHGQHVADRYQTLFPPPILGDASGDGTVDFLDIQPFIAILAARDFQEEADIDRNGVVNFFDILPFIALLNDQ